MKKSRIIYNKSFIYSKNKILCFLIIFYCLSINIYQYLHSKPNIMKIKTSSILKFTQYLALLGGIWYSFICGSELITLIISFTNPTLPGRMYEAEMQLNGIREHSIPFYVYAMCLTMVVAALKAFIWYRLFQLLSKLTLSSPFSRDVAAQLTGLAYLLFVVWLVSSVFWKTYLYYLQQATGITLSPMNNGDEYLFLSGMIYIISKIFLRGIELQEENELTV